jgi:hypothetical protein
LVRVLRSPIMGQLVELLVRLQDTRSSSTFVTMLLQVRTVGHAAKGHTKGRAATC